MTIIFVSVLITSDSDSYYTRTYIQQKHAQSYYVVLSDWMNIRVAWFQMMAMGYTLQSQFNILVSLFTITISNGLVGQKSKPTNLRECSPLVRLSQRSEVNI